MTRSMAAIPYVAPRHWILYDRVAISDALVEAKAAVLSLRSIPYQREWVEALQQMELKREVAGTTKIEGAEFTENELEVATSQTAEKPLLTRSQRQVQAAMKTYRWIPTVPDDRPLSRELLCEIHRQIVEGADDDHCPPGKLRSTQNVTFGQPRHRGVQAGDECEAAVAQFMTALQGPYQDHDPLIRALGAHYHLAAMHPFEDGNGRTARALEALLLQRAGLRDTCFVAMSNYYYDEKPTYLSTLAAVRAQDHTLTSFLIFALKGMAIQAKRLLSAISINVSKTLFRNVLNDLATRLKSKRKRVLVERQKVLLDLLLDKGSMRFMEMYNAMKHAYVSLKNPDKAMIRDLNGLEAMGAIQVKEIAGDTPDWEFSVRLDWPTQVTQSGLFKHLKELPKAKTLRIRP